MKLVVDKKITNSKIHIPINNKASYIMMKQSLSIVIFIFTSPAMVVAQVPTIPPTNEPSTTYVPTTLPVPAPVPFRPCYTNLTEIEDMVKLKNPFTVETYTLCPNTIYEMGFVDSITYQYINGSKPITPRSNCIYQCGMDGKSSNNCVLRGGEIHVHHDFVSYNSENKVGVVLKGITFEDAGTAGAILAAPGDITFIDCIFRNHENIGVMPILYSFDGTRRLSTILGNSEDNGDSSARIVKYYKELLRDPVALAKYKVDAKNSHQRRLQGDDVAEMQSVTLDGCLFEGNKIGPNSDLTQSGIIDILSKSNTITIRNTLFQNNDFDDPINGVNGYTLYAVEGVNVSIIDSCFINNNHIGAGIIVVEDMLTSKGNYGSTDDDDLECEFVRVNNGDICIDFDANQCMANNNTFIVSSSISDTTTDGDTETIAGATSSRCASTMFVTLFMVLFVSLFATM